MAMLVFVKKHLAGILIGFCCIAFVLSGLALWWRDNWLAYQVYVPPGSTNSQAPLLVVLHGTGGDARTTQKWLGFDEFADKYGFVVVYPHSPDGQWDAGAGVMKPGTGERTLRNDSGYVTSIIDEVAGIHSLDREKIFVIGISDGASMAFRLSCVLDGTFAGLVSVAATIPVYANKNCTAAKPLSALFFHGKQDTILPWDGIVYRGTRIYQSLEESVDWWLDRNGCSPQSRDQDYQYFVGHVERRQIKHCQDDTEVVVYRVNDGGHSWPMRDHPRERTTGHVNRDINATAIIVEWLMKSQID
ncbi:MAG: hypothetical protein GY763_10695 [Gammaproteobacteria bacterium]|nr:hypothetical protein [Gammaproteobacteria bacterium]